MEVVATKYIDSQIFPGNKKLCTKEFIYDKIDNDKRIELLRLVNFFFKLFLAPAGTKNFKGGQHIVEHKLFDCQDNHPSL
jgi:hypothetical protein